MRKRVIAATYNQPLTRCSIAPPPCLLFCPPLMDDWGKPLRRAASATKPPATLQVALVRCPPKKTKRAYAGPCAVTLPGEGSGGDGVKAQAGQDSVTTPPQTSNCLQFFAAATRTIP